MIKEYKLMNVKAGVSAIIIMLAGIFLTGMGFSQKNVSPKKLSAESYSLGRGDRLRINVFNEDDLSGVFQIDGSGNISFPLIGEVKSSGQTLRELEERLVQRLKDGYLVNPRVTLEVLNYRPFYILGEVNNPGKYEYVSGINLLNAVAMAGGYTPRGKENSAKITREKTKVVIHDADHSTLIMPGDIIYIDERFF